MKGIAHKLETVGADFINVLRRQGILENFMSFLYQDIEKLAQKNSQASSTNVIPINWLEGKIENIRKMAIESNKSLDISKPDIKVQVFANKELIFKNTDPGTMNVTRFNVYLTSAFNIHRA